MFSNKKNIIIGVVGLVLVMALGFGATYALTKKSSEKPSPTTAISTEPTKGTKGNPHTVDLKKENKVPVDLLIETGNYVQFNSKDGGEHQIIQGLATDSEHGDTSPAQNDHQESDTRPEKAKALDSGVIKSDEGFLLQFNQIGKFLFHDNYNHEYTVTVIVYDPTKKPEAITL